MDAGDDVTVKHFVIRGTVTDTEYDKGAKQLRHLVHFVNEDSENHERWFLESQLEVEQP